MKLSSMAAIPIPEAIPPSSHSSSSNLLTENSYSHYYLHNGDNPGLVLVPQPLIGDNYNTCSRSMRMTPSAKNKLQFIDGSLAKPSNLNGPGFGLGQDAMTPSLHGSSLQFQRRFPQALSTSIIVEICG